MLRNRGLLVRAGLLLGTLCIAAAAQATTYTWKDPKTGRLVISDEPPPPGVPTIGKRSGSGTEGPTPISNMPLATRKAVNEFPVVLFTANDCLEACADARGFLNGRGIPYTELNTRDEATLKRLESLGAENLPTLLVGQQVIQGYHAEAWGKTLDLAGYPSEAPVGYRAPLPPAPEPVESADGAGNESAADAPRTGRGIPVGDGAPAAAQ